MTTEELKSISSTMIHDICVDPYPGGAKKCIISNGCGETIHRLFQNRSELHGVKFHVCDICINCGTLYCSQ